MSDITLTTAIRQNLLSLQNTAANLTTTQERLSTGKKVNTAFDNPTSYFTSQSLTNRANDLGSLLDQIGQAQQTLQEANNGLTSLTSLLEQALSTAQQAQQAALGTVNYSTISGTTAIANDTTQVLSTATVANAVTASGVTASVQSNVNLNAAGIATLASGDSLVYTLGSHTVTATFGTADTTASNTFTDAAGLIAVLNHGAGGSGNFGTAATGITDGSGGVTVWSNDVSTDFSASYTSAHLTANPGDVTTTAHTLGSALTLSDGTHNASFYYVAQNAQATNGTFSNIAGLISSIGNASYSSVNATITPTNPGANGYLQLAAANNVGITAGGAIAGALGFGSSTYENNYNAQLAGLNNDSLTVQVGTDTHTISFGTGANEVSTKTGLTALLGTYGDINGAFNSSNDLVLTPTSTSTVTVGGTPAAAALFGIALGSYNPTATVVTPSSTRSTLQTNFNNLLTQVNQLAADSSYNGINLLNNNNLTVVFNETDTSSLAIQGVNDQSGGLGLTALNNNQFQDNNSINTVVTAINNAITTVRAQTQTFGSNSGTIQTRQSFEQNTINTLQTGSSNLVLADQNQESANLLTLQTRQQLEISALSIANQANQSVLKLFP
jgi:flagellin